jgi:hypothetical protein
MKTASAKRVSSMFLAVFLVLGFAPLGAMPLGGGFPLRGLMNQR